MRAYRGRVVRISQLEVKGGLKTATRVEIGMRKTVTDVGRRHRGWLESGGASMPRVNDALISTDLAQGRVQEGREVVACVIHFRCSLGRGRGGSVCGVVAAFLAHQLPALVTVRTDQHWQHMHVRDADTACPKLSLSCACACVLWRKEAYVPLAVHYFHPPRSGARVRLTAQGERSWEGGSNHLAGVGGLRRAHCTRHEKKRGQDHMHETRPVQLGSGCVQCVTGELVSAWLARTSCSRAQAWQHMHASDTGSIRNNCVTSCVEAVLCSDRSM